MKSLSIVLLLVLFYACSFEAKVIGVSDGDTIKVLTGKNETLRIRLEGIDCPESGQPFGNRAREFTADLCFGKSVTLEEKGEDQYGRVLADVWIGDVCLNRELVKNGLAWHYKNHNSDFTLARLEREAQAQKIGLWSDKNPIAPWNWRKRQRSN